MRKSQQQPEESVTRWRMTPVLPDEQHLFDVLFAKDYAGIEDIIRQPIGLLAAEYGIHIRTGNPLMGDPDILVSLQELRRAESPHYMRSSRAIQDMVAYIGTRMEARYHRVMVSPRAWEIFDPLGGSPGPVQPKSTSDGRHQLDTLSLRQTLLSEIVRQMCACGYRTYTKK